MKEARLLILLAVGIAAIHGSFGEAPYPSWDIWGSFGFAPGRGEVGKDGGMVSVTADYRIETKVEKGEGGVELRKTTFTNIGKQELRARRLIDRFDFNGGEYEVYTQANSWQQESRGGWQPLVTTVETRGGTVRSCYGATPMLALWNVQTKRGRVFHVLATSAWEMHASRLPSGGETTFVSVEIGMDGRYLDYAVKPGESVELPQVLTYEFSNRTDLDCHLLHAWWHAHYPKRSIPAIYNTWMSRFDGFDAEHVLSQVPIARQIGLDYFVLDAGWFGLRRDWGRNRGDWSESKDGALGGRMMEISEAVRKNGMKFGFWVEAESAHPESEIVKRHPDWFFSNGHERFLDFRKREAFNYMLDTVTALLSRYHASFLKFDFNQNAMQDRSGKAFDEYNRAYARFVRAVRERNPGVYIEGCASGGLMMDLGWAREFDSFWLSDNQSPYHGIRIVKDTLLRMPPQMIERWIVAYSDHGRQRNYENKFDRILATDDATWTNVRSVGRDYLDAFVRSGPIGFSCDLTGFSAPEIEHWRQVVSESRKDAEFWNKAVGRILCDTPTLLVLQFSDPSLADVRLTVIGDRVRQQDATVYPTLDASYTYRIGDKELSAAEIARDGIRVKLHNYQATEIRMQRK